MQLTLDILQAAGLGAACGISPFLPVLVAGGLARAKLGIDFAGTDYAFLQSQWFLLGSSDFTVPKYWLANANLTLSPASGAPWTVTLWGRNIFNKAYDITRNFFLPSSEVAQAGEPATVGIRVSYKY